MIAPTELTFTDTRREARESIAPHEKALCVACLDTLRRFGPLTADEIAAHLERTIFTIRPRISELKAAGLVSDTGQRRRARCGLGTMQKVWALSALGCHQAAKGGAQ